MTQRLHVAIGTWKHKSRRALVMGQLHGLLTKEASALTANELD